MQAAGTELKHWRAQAAWWRSQCEEAERIAWGSKQRCLELEAQAKASAGHQHSIARIA